MVPSVSNHQPTTPTPQQQAVLKLAGWGFKVGPLHGKVPRTPRGLHDFTNSRHQVTQWWTKWPNANIGARVFVGCVVVDIDPRNGGAGTWADLTHGHQVPPTLTTKTGSGGLHYWFRLPHAGLVRGSAGAGIDLKTHKGYLVMPGSIHPDTGKPYSWEHWGPIAPVPTWLEPHIYKPPAPPPPRFTSRPGAPGTSSGRGLIDFVAAAPAGNRNGALYWAACRAIEEQLPILPQLAAAAQQAGLDAIEISRTIKSAHTKGEHQ